METKDLFQGSVTPQSCAYVPVVEETTKVLRVSFNSPLSQATTKIKPGFPLESKGNTNFPVPLTSTNRGHHRATPSWLGFQEPKSNRAKIISQAGATSAQEKDLTPGVEIHEELTPISLTKMRI